MDSSHQTSSPLLLRLTPGPPQSFRSGSQHPFLLLALHHTCLYLPFLLPPFPFRRVIFITLASIVTLQLLHTRTGLGTVVDYITAITTTGYTIRLADFLGSSGPPEKNPTLTCPQKGWEGGFKSWDLLQRLQAVEAFYRNPRGVGWGWRVRGKWESTAPQSRGKFVITNLLQFLLMVALAIPVHIYYPISPGPWPWYIRSLRANASVFVVYATLNGINCLSSAFWVGARVSAPEDWPPLFGNPRDCWSIRRLWGSFWHKMHTHMSDSHSRVLVRLLGLPETGRVTYLLRVYVAFFVTAVIHAAPAYAVSGSDGGSLAFFMLQAVGITVEEMVGGLGRGRWKRIGGRVWVILWFGITNVVIAEGYVASGMYPILNWRWMLGYEEAGSG